MSTTAIDLNNGSKEVKIDFQGITLLEIALLAMELALCTIHILAIFQVGCFNGPSGGMILGAITIPTAILLRAGVVWIDHQRGFDPLHRTPRNIEAVVYTIAILVLSVLGIDGTLSCMGVGIGVYLFYCATLQRQSVLNYALTKHHAVA